MHVFVRAAATAAVVWLFAGPATAQNPTSSSTTSDADLLGPAPGESADEWLERLRRRGVWVPGPVAGWAGGSAMPTPPAVLGAVRRPESPRVAPAAAPRTTAVAPPAPTASTTTSAAPAVAGKVGRTPTATATLTNELVVFLRPGSTAADVASAFGLTDAGSVGGLDGLRVFRAASPAAADAARGRLAADPRVEVAANRYAGGSARAKFTANDPFFFPGPNPGVGGTNSSTADPIYPGQWHLINNMPASGVNSPSTSVNVGPAWGRELTGAGVVIGIVDDGIEVTHADLAPNGVAGLHFNFVNNNTDPAPTAAGQNHGTAVAGVAAARGGNGVGVSGAAPLAGLAGLRVGNYDATFVVPAYAHQSAAIRVKNHSYGPAFPYDASYAPVAAAIAASAAAGTINVVAVGNDRGDGFNEDGNKAYPQNSPHAIVVAALGSRGRFAVYPGGGSSFGASITVTAPSDGAIDEFYVTTTDRTAAAGYNQTGSANFAAASGGGTGLSYTNQFGGTSASAPLVSGVIALAVQANPTLLNNTSPAGNTRFVKHLLARTSTQVDATDATAASDGGWRTNAAGVRFNQNYGFGLINADALTQAATQFVGVTPLTTHATGTVAVGAALPDGGTLDGTAPGAFVSRSVVVAPANPQPLEEVIVTLSVTTTFAGDIEGFIQSPAGYRSRFMYRAGDDGTDNVNWTFLTNAFWGTDAAGTWQIDVRDVYLGDNATWNSFAVEFRMGTLVPVPEPAFAGLAAVGLVLLARRRSRTAPTTGTRSAASAGPA